MKIYTRTGDEGETGLFAGGRVSKDDPRIEAIGAVDELNSWLGWVVANGGWSGSRGGVESELWDRVAQIQSWLFSLGAELATGKRDRLGDAVLPGDAVGLMESWIDEAEGDLPELRHFILPGGSVAGAGWHVARTVCRRAERRVARLASEPEFELSPAALPVLNRLADLLFVWARWQNRRDGVEETPWRGGGAASGGS